MSHLGYIRKQLNQAIDWFEDAPVKIQDGDALVLIRQLEVFNETTFNKEFDLF
jgi:hypothetical protein